MSRYGRDGDCRVLLKRDNFNVPWGFRLQGGVDLGAPLTVQRVFSGSPADSQLQRGDVVLAIDDRDVTTCNLNQIQELIKSAGSSLSVGVRRGRDVVNDTSIVNQTISFQQQPSFVTKNISSPLDYAIPVQNQYQDNQRAAVSSTSFYPSNQASSPSRQIPVYHASTQEQAAPVVRQAMVHQANVSQTPVHQTQSRQAPPMTNQQAGYSSQDFNQNFQPAPRVSNVDDRKSFNVQQPAASIRVQQSPIRSQVPQFSSQQDKPARYGPQDDLPNYGYSDEHHQQQQFHPQQRQQQQQQGQQQQLQGQQQQQRSQFGSNDQTLSQQEQAEEDEEQFKSIQEIKQMFNKPDPANAPAPRPKGVTNQPRGPMSGRKTSPYPPKSTYNPLEFVGTNERAGSALSKAPPTSVRKTPPYQQKSSYNPLDFVGVTGKPKEAPSKPPGSIQRGPPPEQAPSMPPHGPQQEVDPMMDFYLHGFDSKHGGPPPNLKFNGVSHDQPGPKPGGYGGHLLPPRTTPAMAKAAPAKKKEFNPAQSSVYLALLEEEERAKSGGQAEPEPPSSPVPRQAQYQQQQQKPRKPMGGQSSASRLQELLERDQAQLAPYQEEDARPQQTNQQMSHQQMSHQQMNQQMSHQPMNQQMSRQQMSHQPMNQQMNHQQMSQPTYTSNQQFKPSSPQRMDYQSSPLPYSTQNKSFSPHQAPYHAPTAYSNEGDYYGRSDGGRSDGYGAGYPVTDF